MEASLLCRVSVRPWLLRVWWAPCWRWGVGSWALGDAPRACLVCGQRWLCVGEVPVWWFWLPPWVLGVGLVLVLAAGGVPPPTPCKGTDRIIPRAEQWLTQSRESLNGQFAALEHPRSLTHFIASAGAAQPIATTWVHALLLYAWLACSVPRSVRPAAPSKVCQLRPRLSTEIAQSNSGHCQH